MQSQDSILKRSRPPGFIPSPNESRWSASSDSLRRIARSAQSSGGLSIRKRSDPPAALPSSPALVDGPSDNYPLDTSIVAILRQSILGPKAKGSSTKFKPSEAFRPVDVQIGIAASPTIGPNEDTALARDQAYRRLNPQQDAMRAQPYLDIFTMQSHANMAFTTFDAGLHNAIWVDKKTVPKSAMTAISFSYSLLGTKTPATDDAGPADNKSSPSKDTKLTNKKLPPIDGLIPVNETTWQALRDAIVEHQFSGLWIKASRREIGERSADL